MRDSRSRADVLAGGLRDQGMAVDAAHDGLEAAAKLELNAYDVVVLDRDLPGIHGDTLCQMITDRDDRVMVLMLSAASAPGERVSGLGLGADDYLAKPFHFPELSRASVPSRAASPPPGAGFCARPGLSLTRCAARSPATGGSFTFRSRSSRSSKRSSAPRRPSSARRACSNRPGTSMPTRSPTRSR